MRKLLVASQKSGVGKTTTSINLAAGAARGGARVLLVETDPLNNVSAALNLAQYSQRRPLREAGIDLPGVLYCDVVPGLDVFSPYEEGGCSDDDLDRLLQMLSLDVFRESYDCLVLNAPPFFGGRPAPLLATCDEFLVVMQAEPMAYRTMPAFLEMVQRASQEEKNAGKMRGILLTLPESETPGGRWERELRGRFGSRVLAQVIPYDADLGKAALFSQIAVHSIPESQAAQAYQELVGELKLSRDPARTSRTVETTLALAAAAVRANPLHPRTPAASPASTVRKRSSARIPRLRTPASVGAPLRRSAASETPLVPPELPAEPVAPARHLPPEPVHAPPYQERAHPERAQPHAQPQPQPAAPPAQKPWLLWVALAMAAGVGMRFVQLPPVAVPVIVGLAVTAGVTLMLHLVMQASEAQRQQQNRSAPTPPAGTPSTPPPGRHSGPHRKLPGGRSSRREG